MRRRQSLRVSGKDGWKGVIETALLLQGSEPLVLVRVVDGQEFLVPSTILTPLEDGTFYVPLTSGELTGQGDGHRCRVSPADFREPASDTVLLYEVNTQGLVERTNRRRSVTKTVVALYDNFSAAREAVPDLVDNEFRSDDIGLLAGDATGQHRDELRREVAGLGTDAGPGGVLDGLAGVLVGLSTLAAPGMGPVIVAGPLAAALAGAGVGAITGGLVGVLLDVGVPEREAQFYAEGIRRGGTLVTVRVADDRADEACEILNRYGAVDVQARGKQWRQEGWHETELAREPEVDLDLSGPPDYAIPPLQIDTSAGQPPTEVPHSVAAHNDDALTAIFREHCAIVHGQDTSGYERYEPAYHFGYALAIDEGHQGQKWGEIEPEARRRWIAAHGDEVWDDAQLAIRYGWERAVEATHREGPAAGTSQADQADSGTWLDRPS